MQNVEIFTFSDNANAKCRKFLQFAMTSTQNVEICTFRVNVNAK